MLAGLRKRVDRVRRSWWKVGRARRLQIYAYWRSRPVRSRTVMYESFGGNGALCNPEAIFRELRADPEFADLKHVWVLSHPEDNPSFVREFARDRSVRFVRPASAGYYRALATSGYLINNATFPGEFSKRAEQVYLNTWHGTPLKRMGYDIGDVASRVANVIRNLLSADYLLSANSYMTEHMYESAHLLTNLYGGLVIEEGYPRIDRQFVDAAGAASIRAQLEEAGLAIGDRKVILYAPTWKGSSFADPRNDADDLIHRVIELESRLNDSEYVVLLKTHQVVHKYADRPEFAGRLVPNEVPSNSVLAITDILVTDYSSIFFDFLATGRPIAFLAPDIEDYAGYRGLYLEPGDWPGPVTSTLDELAAALNAIIDSGPDAAVEQRRRRMQESFTSREDGGATKRIIDIVFRGARDGYAIAPVKRDGRRTMLVHAGSMLPGAITKAVIEHLDAIDHERFDVSVVFPYSNRRAALEQQRRIHPAVRQFARIGTMNGTVSTRVARRLAWRTPDSRTSPAQRAQWDDEWMRCFGLTRFDHVVDFHGQGRLWSRLMLHAPGAHRSIWLHGDRAAYARKLAASNRRRLHEVETVFATYRGYDALVSESAELNAANASGLAAYAEQAAFTWANGLDPDRVGDSAAADATAGTEASPAAAGA
jgi:CDP-glycerol glycerophosphotransferase (TagB/SpsB family)